MESHCVVLMSTYNGQTYLKEQLDCIFSQTYPGKITIWIRDDGSRDDTVSIIEAYPQTPTRQIRLEKASNVGPQRSFLELIQMAGDADYYFFADQDDVWDPDKVEIAAAAMSGVEVPASYCSNYRLSDMDLKVYDTAAIKQTPQFTPLSILFYNQIPGCVMGMNRALMQTLKRVHVENVMMHDSMALSCAALAGKVIYDPNPRITHRIHRDNVVGDGHKKIVLRKWIPEKFRLLTRKEDYDVSVLAEEFIKAAGESIHPEYLEDIHLLRDYKKTRKNTRRLLKHPDTQGPAFDRTTLSIRCKIFFHIF